MENHIFSPLIGHKLADEPFGIVERRQGFNPTRLTAIGELENAE
jgi:hypothetical protein